MKTYRLRAGEMDRRWHVLDAKGRPLGRIAGEAARLLMGKHKPTYEPHLPMGDFVVIVNAREIALTGNKAQQKVYYRHSGYPGGLKERSFREQMQRDPRRVVERAVRGMLPSTSLGRELFRHLKVYAGPTHPHEAQVRAGMGARSRKRAGDLATAEDTIMQQTPQGQDAERAEEIEREEVVEAIMGPTAGITQESIEASPEAQEAAEARAGRGGGEQPSQGGDSVHHPETPESQAEHEEQAEVMEAILGPAAGVTQDTIESSAEAQEAAEAVHPEEQGSSQA